MRRPCRRSQFSRIQPLARCIGSFRPRKPSATRSSVVMESASKSLSSLLEAAEHLSAQQIARMAADIMVELEDDHAAAISVADDGGVTTEQRQIQTQRVLNIIARLIRRAFPIIAPSKIPVCAFTLMQLFKMVTIVSRSQAPQAKGAIGELRSVIELYLRSLGEAVLEAPPPRRKEP